MITIQVCLQVNTQRPTQKFLVLNLLVYIYDAQGDMFKPLPDMPPDLPQQILDANEALQRITAGQPLHTLCYAVTQNAIWVPDVMTDAIGVLLQDTAGVFSACLHWECQTARNRASRAAGTVHIGACHTGCAKGLSSCTSVLHMGHI